MKKLLVATRNMGKAEEIRELLLGMEVELLTFRDFPDILTVEETGTTFEENAILKARTAALAAGLPTLADDSGLEVDALGNRPGVLSARFAGEPADDKRNNEKLLELLKNVHPEEKNARFVCAIAIALPDGTTHTTRAACEGIILGGLRGSGGFGYDPLFYIPELKKTFAELTMEEKNRISHRGKALRAAAGFLRKIYQDC